MEVGSVVSVDAAFAECGSEPDVSLLVFDDAEVASIAVMDGAFFFLEVCGEGFTVVVADSAVGGSEPVVSCGVLEDGTDIVACEAVFFAGVDGHGFTVVIDCSGAVGSEPEVAVSVFIDAGDIFRCELVLSFGCGDGHGESDELVAVVIKYAVGSCDPEGPVAVDDDFVEIAVVSGFVPSAFSFERLVLCQGCEGVLVVCDETF